VVPVLLLPGDMGMGMDMGMDMRRVTRWAVGAARLMIF
jgi:hypothetical protein